MTIFNFRGRTRPFIVIFQGRSGSTYLMEALNRHPEILARMEMLVALKERGAKFQLKQARRYLRPPLFRCSRVIGFKTKLKDVLDPVGFAALLKSLDTRVILLLRRNRVKAVVSLFNAIRLNTRTGEWNLYDEKDRLPPFSVEKGKFEARLNQMETEKRQIEDYAAALDLPILRMDYEDIFGDQNRAFERIFRFLEVGFADIFGKTLKNTSDDLRQILVNFEDLRRHFKNTPYEGMFDG